MNIQVRTTDQNSAISDADGWDSNSGVDGYGDSGVVTNIQGNRLIANGNDNYNWYQDSVSTNMDEYSLFNNSLEPRCIASIVDEKNDKP